MEQVQMLANRVPALDNACTDTGHNCLQDAYGPNSYQYYRSFADLPDDNTHLVVCVCFRWRTDPDRTVREEKFVTTAYFQCFEE